ncbi:hypothetical protein [Faecalicoccus acidiformans]|uniref:Uncharacterized protein n=1 Tax=Faecalicoccus acidiformans TaxID=915173 RepID=A0ABS2FM03_9FIRM|nr:hypothetical protein [Faecalicoccus acidiformans]MBM6831011.1 hypothetical protein [Faecalicoccus acidiformans]
MKTAINNYENALEISNELNEFAKDFDTYEHMDCVDDEREEVMNVAKKLMNSEIFLEGIKNYLNEFIEDDNEEEGTKRAEKILQKIEIITKMS